MLYAYGRLPMMLTGPVRLWTIDADNPQPSLVRVTLVRSTGSVLLDMLVAPYRARRPYPSLDEEEPSWLWDCGPWGQIVIPSGSSVTLDAPGVPTLTGHFGYSEMEPEQ